MAPLMIRIELDQAVLRAGDDVRSRITFYAPRAPALHSPSLHWEASSEQLPVRRPKRRLDLHRQQMLLRQHRAATSVEMRRSYSGTHPPSPHHLSSPLRDSESANTGDATSASATAGRRPHHRSVSIVTLPSEKRDAGTSAVMRPPAPTESNARPLQRSISIQKEHNRTNPGFDQAQLQDPSGAADPAAQGSDLESSIPLRPILPARMHTEGQRDTSFSDPRDILVDVTDKSVAARTKSARNAVGSSPSKSRFAQSSLTNSSLEGTPRSSSELYSQSNHSTDTMTSEYISSPTSGPAEAPRRLFSGVHAPSDDSSRGGLMMGYVQLAGSCTLDGSLVAQAPFDQVKKKAIIGGQAGGGVVGVERAKRRSGFLTSLGWSNLSQSIGGMLGSAEPSSLRDMKSLANARAIPVLSTPQSVLFVDLQLRPGQSRTFLVSHRLPAALPPSYKGRSIKIHYRLIVGTQRSGKSSEQSQIRRFEIGFTILTPSQGSQARGMNSAISDGPLSAGTHETFDLMRPHILLDETADVSMASGLAPAPPQARLRDPSTAPSRSKAPTDASDMPLLQKCEESGLFRFLQRQLAERRPGITEASERHRQSFHRNPLSTHRSSFGLKDFTNPNTPRIGAKSLYGSSSFHIQRAGQSVATIHLATARHQTGAVFPLVIGSLNRQVSCYAIYASLETTEEVRPSYALRSASSIARATRRLHAQRMANAIDADRLVLNLTIPQSATPTFQTSAVDLKWTVRVEFVVAPREEVVKRPPKLLEPVSLDNRGTVTAAAPELLCESLEVSVPLIVDSQGVLSMPSESMVAYKV